MGFFTWNGLGIAVTQATDKVAEVQRAKKTTIWVVAAVVALGFILFMRGK